MFLEKTNMKILYICENLKRYYPFLIEYQGDSLLLGLKELFGDDVVDVNRKHNLYWDYPESEIPTEYGRGFTYTRNLKSDNTDRDDIEHKIKSKFFDLVVYGNCHRNRDYLSLVCRNYPEKKIIFVDGEHFQTVHPTVIYLRGLYFKTELNYSKNTEHQRFFYKLFPTSFGFPTEKVKFDYVKEKTFAQCDPRDTSTYIFNNEVDYYRDYGISKYAFTTQKAGWDCARHYEIMGNGCVPLFPDLESCPKHAMFKFPKDLLIDIYKQYTSDFDGLNRRYDEVRAELLDHFVKNHTTLENAKFFIDNWRSLQNK